MTRRPDTDDLNRVIDNLAAQHGDLTVSEPNAATGSVTIDCEDGAHFRYTAQNRLIAAKRTGWNQEGARS